MNLPATNNQQLTTDQTEHLKQRLQAVLNGEKIEYDEAVKLIHILGAESFQTRQDIVRAGVILMTVYECIFDAGERREMEEKIKNPHLAGKQASKWDQAKMIKKVVFKIPEIMDVFEREGKFPEYIMQKYSTDIESYRKAQRTAKIDRNLADF